MHIDVAVEKKKKNLYKWAKHGFATLNPSGGACSVMVIVVGNGHGDTISNPGRGCISHSTNRYESNYSPSSYE